MKTIFFESEISKGAATLWLSRIFVQVLTVITMIVFSRELGPKTFGILAVGLAFTQYLEILTNKGMEVEGTRSAAKKADQDERLLFRFIWSRIVICLIIILSASAILGVFSTHIPQLQLKVLLVILPIVVFRGLLLEWYLQAKKKFSDMTKLWGVRAIITLFLALILVSGPEDIYFAVFSIVLGGFAAMALSWYLSGATLFNVFKNRFELSCFWVCYKSSRAMGLAAGLAAMYNISDIILISVFSGAYEVGQYRASMQLQPLVITLPFCMAQVYFPRLALLQGGGINAGEFWRVAFIVSMISFGAGFLLYILAPVIVPIIFGGEYSSTKDLTKILAWKMSLMSVSFFLGQTLQAWHEERNHLRIVLLGAVASICLNLVVIPKYAAFGAAWVSVTTEFLVACLFLLCVFSHLRKSKQDVLRSIK